MASALESILGPDAPGLSATNIVRLKRIWETEYKDWAKRDLTGKRYVYVWVDGIYFNVRLEEPDTNRMCFLVMMGALENGKKELVAILDGYRESKSSWLELLLSVKQRGLTEDRSWPSVMEAWASGRRCRKSTPRPKSSAAGSTRPQISWIRCREASSRRPRRISTICTWRRRRNRHSLPILLSLALWHEVPKACECLTRDKDVLFTFYDFPAEHWIHLRSTNPIESTFATVRHRTKRTKGCGTRLATLTMVFKLCKQAEKTWKRIKGYRLIAKVIEGVRFVDGELADGTIQAA